MTRSLTDAARLLLDVWDTMRHRCDVASLYRPIAALRAALDTRSRPATPSEAALAAASHYCGEKSDELLALAEHFDDFAAARLDAQRMLWEEVSREVYQIECDLRDRLGRAEAVIAAIGIRARAGDGERTFAACTTDLLWIDDACRAYRTDR